MDTDKKLNILAPFSLASVIIVLYSHQSLEQITANKIKLCLEKRHSTTISSTSLNKVLTRLVKKGLINKKMSKPRKMRGGRSRRLFSITAKGIIKCNKIKILLSSLISDLQ